MHAPEINAAKIADDAECVGAIALLANRFRDTETPADITKPEWKIIRGLMEGIDIYLANTGFGYETDSETAEPLRRNPLVEFFSRFFV